MGVFSECLPDAIRATRDAQRRTELLNDDRFLDDLHAHLPECDSVAVARLIRNLAAWSSPDERRSLSRFISPLIAMTPLNSAFQALVNLVQDFPDFANIVFFRLRDQFASFYDEFNSIRALLIACIRCDKASFDDFLAGDLLPIVMTVDDDDDRAQWALLVVRLLIETSHLHHLIGIGHDQVRFAIEVLDDHLDNKDVGPFIFDVLDSISLFSPSEKQLDLLYATLSLASTYILLPTALVQGKKLAQTALNFLAAFGMRDGPKPTRIEPNDDIPKTPPSMKAILVRLLANLSGVDKAARMRIGQDDALIVLLNQAGFLGLSMMDFSDRFLSVKLTIRIHS
jgi:hypothetical protein